MTRMQMTSKLSALMTFGLVVGLTGCGKGFSASSSGSNSNSSSSTNGTAATPADAAFKSLVIDGTISGGSDTTTQVIQIDKLNKMLIARLPLPIGTLGGASMVPVPLDQIPGATVGIEPTASGGSALTVRIPLAALMKGITLLPAGRLPNGDPLPAVPDGELPSLAIQLNKLANTPITLYLAPSVFAIYVESPVNPYIGLTLPIRNAAHTQTWGYFSSVPAKTPFNGGFFMSLAVPGEIARIIDDAL